MYAMRVEGSCLATWQPATSTHLPCLVGGWEEVGACVAVSPAEHVQCQQVKIAHNSNLYPSPPTMG